MKSEDSIKLEGVCTLLKRKVKWNLRNDRCGKTEKML